MLTTLCIALAHLQGVGQPGRLVIIPQKDKFEFACLELPKANVRHYDPPAVFPRSLKAESAVADAESVVANKEHTLVAILRKDLARVDVYSVGTAALLCSLSIKDLGKGDTGIYPTVAWHKTTLCIYIRSLITDKDLGSFAFSVGGAGGLSKVPVPTPVIDRIVDFIGKTKTAHAKIYTDGDYPFGHHRLDPRLTRFEVFGDLYGGSVGSLSQDTGGFIVGSGVAPVLRVYSDFQFAWTLSPQTKGLASQIRIGKDEVFLGFPGDVLEVWSLQTRQLLRRIEACVLVDE